MTTRMAHERRAPNRWRRARAAILAALATTALIAGGAPASAETPEQRCQRETATYNAAQESAWRATHPGQQVPNPAPWPPYICVGGPDGGDAGAGGGTGGGGMGDRPDRWGDEPIAGGGTGISENGQEVGGPRTGIDRSASDPYAPGALDSARSNIRVPERAFQSGNEGTGDLDLLDAPDAEVRNEHREARPLANGTRSSGQSNRDIIGEPVEHKCGNIVVIRRGYYDSETDRGMGLDKVTYKHGLNESRLRRSLREHCPNDESSPGAQIYMDPQTMTDCSYLTPGSLLCEDTEISTAIRTIVNNATKQSDGRSRGVITAYCTGYEPKCPTWINSSNNMVRMNGIDQYADNYPANGAGRTA